MLFSEKAAKLQSSESADRFTPKINKGEMTASRIRMQWRLALKWQFWCVKAALLNVKLTFQLGNDYFCCFTPLAHLAFSTEEHPYRVLLV